MLCRLASLLIINDKLYMCTNCKECKKGSWSGCSLATILKVLIIVGGINWGIVGIGMLEGNPLNLVNMLFGTVPTLEAIVYIVVGIAAVFSICGCKCKTCKEGTCCSTCDSSKKE